MILVKRLEARDSYCQIANHSMWINIVTMAVITEGNCSAFWEIHLFAVFLTERDFLPMHSSSLALRLQAGGKQRASSSVFLINPWINQMLPVTSLIGE